MSADTNKIRLEAFLIAQDIDDMCVGRSTAAVYLAISAVLASMEMEGARPDREGLFRILNSGMDEYIKARRSVPG